LTGGSCLAVSGEPCPRQKRSKHAGVQPEGLQKEAAFGQIVVDAGHMVQDIMLAARPASTM